METVFHTISLDREIQGILFQTPQIVEELLQSLLLL